MKVAISSTGNDLAAAINPRFGRCEYFIIVESDDMSFSAYANESGSLSGGAGIQAAGFVADKGATAVLTGNCGPKAMTAFNAAGIRVYTGQTGTVRESVERLKTGILRPSAEPTVAEKNGLAADGVTPVANPGGAGRCQGGPGRGMGMGGGRGMGRGGGMSRGGGMGRCGGRGMGGGGGKGI